MKSRHHCQCLSLRYAAQFLCITLSALCCCCRFWKALGGEAGAWGKALGPSRPRPLARARSCLRSSLDATGSRHRSIISVQFVGPPALRSLCLDPSPLSPQSQPQFRPPLHAPGPSPSLQSISNVLPERSFHTHPPLLTALLWVPVGPLDTVPDPQPGVWEPVPRGKESLPQTCGVPEACQPLSRPGLSQAVEHPPILLHLPGHQG